MTGPGDIGPIGRLPPGQVVRAAGLVREGRTISLAATRYPGMPLFPGHPPFQVLNYRTPRGIRVTGAQPWGPSTTSSSGTWPSTSWRPPTPGRTWTRSRT